MAKSADPGVVAEIRRLASDPQRVMITRTAQFDLVARHLTKDEICQVIIEWIDSGERIKPTTIHSFSGLQGQQAFELKPRIQGIVFYIKVALVEWQQPGEYLLLISAHPDRLHAICRGVVDDYYSLPSLRPRNAEKSQRRLSLRTAY